MYRYLLCFTIVSLLHFFSSYNSVDGPQDTPSKGMRGRAGSHAFGVAYRGQTIEGLSEEDAEEAFEFLTSEPVVASNALQVAQNFHSSSQGSYGSVQATKDASEIAKRRKRRKSK
jgi:hypothetical protein